MACWARMQSSSLRCSASVPSYVHGKIASNTRLSCVASFGRPLKLVALKSGGHKNRKGLPLPVVTATLGLEESSDGDGVAAATNGRNVVEEAKLGQQGQSMEVDTVTEAELKENGFRSTQRMKLIYTIDPATCAPEQLEALAMGGMNVARLTMCHGTRDWHTQVICNVRSLNSEKEYSVVVMMDIEGREIHMGDFNGAPSVKAEDGEEWIFTVRKLETLPDFTAIVNYDGFAEDVRVGDELVVDGEMVRFEVKEKVGPDVKCKCIDPGLLLPRANLTFWREGQLVQEQNATLPTISSKDWIDIDFGIAQGVDFIAVSFVKTSEDIKHLKSYIRARSPNKSIGVFVKIESSTSLKNLEDIIRVSDGAMVARGDLGAQVPLEQVPSVQQTIVNLCRELDKPVIVASQLLESMIEFPAPTRAEVVDVSEGVLLQAYFDPNSNMAQHAPPMKSFQMGDGTCVDCIPIEGQISTHHPLLKDHVIQMAPSRGPRRLLESHPQAFAWGHGGCPEGTIPVLRDDPIGKFMKKVVPPRRAPTPVGIENPALDVDTTKHEYAITSTAFSSTQVPNCK